MALQRVCESFQIDDLNPYQREAITNFVEEKGDIFVNLSTGFGKSLIYQALPLVFDVTSNSPGHIVAVVSPLVSLMQGGPKTRGFFVSESSPNKLRHIRSQNGQNVERLVAKRR